MHVQGRLGKQTQTSSSWIRRKEMMKVSESDSSSSDDVELQENKGGRTQARIRQRAPPRTQREPAEKLVSGLIRNAAVGTRGQRISSTQAGAETSQLPDPVGSPFHTSVVIHAKRNLPAVTGRNLLRTVTAQPGPITFEVSCGESSDASTESDRFQLKQAMQFKESPWDAPVVLHQKQCLTPFTPESSPTSGPADVSPPRLPVNGEDSPFDVPIVVHAKRMLRASPDVETRNNTSASAAWSPGFDGPLKEMRPAPSSDPEGDAFAAPMVIHSKRYLMTIASEGSCWGSSDDSTESLRFEHKQTIGFEESPWHAPIVMHQKRILTPISPESSPDFGPAGAPLLPEASPWEVPVLIHAKRSLTTATLELSPSDLHASSVVIPRGLAAGASSSRFPTAVAGVLAEATPPSRQRNTRILPTYRTKVAREVAMMLESADDDVKSWTCQMLDARGMLNRAMRESDSDDDLYDPESISSRKASEASRSSRAAAAAARAQLESTNEDSSTSSRCHDLSESAVHARLAHTLKPQRAAEWSDDEDAAVEASTLAKRRMSLSPDEEERERSMELYRSARRLVLMERKAMLLSNASFSDDDEQQPEPRIIEREINRRLSSNKSPRAPSLSVTESAEKESAIIEGGVEEDEHMRLSDSQLCPSSFLTPLRTKRPIPGGLPSVGSSDTSIVGAAPLTPVRLLSERSESFQASSVSIATGCESGSERDLLGP